MCSFAVRIPPAANDMVTKLLNRLKSLEQQMNKRKRENDMPTRNVKGKGKGKERVRGRAPGPFQGLPTTTPENEPICYSFNLARGCPVAKKGERCTKGWHLCPRCIHNGPSNQALHSLENCPAR